MTSQVRAASAGHVNGLNVAGGIGVWAWRGNKLTPGLLTGKDDPERRAILTWELKSERGQGVESYLPEMFSAG